MSQESGKFVVVDGIDGSGKATQVGLVAQELTKQGRKVKVWDFPRYGQTMAGDLCGRMQMGEFGDPWAINPYLACQPYIADQRLASPEIVDWVREGGVALGNRWVTSNVHQAGKIEPEIRGEYFKWLWKYAYEDQQLVKPDLVVVLLVDLPICRVNIESKAARSYTVGQGLDLVERNVKYQEEAASGFRYMVQEDPTWVVINCSPDGPLLKPEDITGVIMEEIKRRGVV